MSCLARIVALVFLLSTVPASASVGDSAARDSGRSIGEQTAIGIAAAAGLAAIVAVIWYLCFRDDDAEAARTEAADRRVVDDGVDGHSDAVEGPRGDGATGSLDARIRAIAPSRRSAP